MGQIVANHHIAPGARLQAVTIERAYLAPDYVPRLLLQEMLRWCRDHAAQRIIFPQRGAVTVENVTTYTWVFFFEHEPSALLFKLRFG